MWLGLWLSALLSKVTAQDRLKMQSFRDANLWRPKLGRLSFFLYPPPTPQKKIDPGPNGNDLEHYMTSYMMLHD